MTTPKLAKLTSIRLALASRDAADRALPWMRAEPVAIVGMACRFPGASTLGAFRDLLWHGRDAVSELPAGRWDRARYYDADPSVPGRTYVARGGYLDSVDEFDADFFGISQREAASLDPQQRLLLELGWEALEHASIAPDSLYGQSVGVFFGVSSGDYASMLRRRNAPATIDGYHATGNAFSVTAGRVSYFLGLKGPSLAVDTACSSSLVAVHLAVQSLRMRECSAALAGGVNLLLEPESWVNFSKARMLAPDGRCKAYDARADGFVRGEGGGVVVLKLLSAAVADGDAILAVIRGSAVNQDGASSGLTAPSGPSQEAVLRAALDAAGVEPRQVGYIEGHGTGTALGDPIELSALADVFGPGRPTSSPLLVGSLKANIGHLESAAGIAGLIKATLALHGGAVPPQIHFEQPSEHLDWERSGLAVATDTTPFPGVDERRLAGVSSFGFSGTNAHVVLEAFDQGVLAAAAPAVARPRELLLLSAKDPAALDTLVERYAAHLAAAPGIELGALCRAAAVGRSHFAHRLCVTAASVDELARLLRQDREGVSSPHVVRGRALARSRARIAFVFSGQGAEWEGMGKELYALEPAFREGLERCAEAMQGAAQGEDIPGAVRALLDGRGAGQMADTAAVQPALFAYEYALASLWRSWGVQPDFVIGHSVGEITAACVAEALSLEDAARLVVQRGRLMARLPRNGKMVALIADPERVRALAEKRRQEVSVAAVNGPRQVVLAGQAAAIDALVAELSPEMARELPVSHAFHSPLIAPMLDEFHAVAQSVQFRAPRLPLISNVSGELAGAEIASPAYWVQQARQTVRFADGIDTLWRKGAQVFLEIGPSPGLSRLVRECVAGDREVSALPSACSKQGEWAQLVDTVARLHVRGVSVDWRAWMRRYQGAVADAPTYPFRRRRFWPEGPDHTAPSAAPAASALAKRSDIESWGYAPSWTRTAPPLHRERAEAPASVLVVASAGDHGRLVQALARDGSDVVAASSASQAELAAGLEILLTREHGARRIVLLAPAVGDHGTRPDDPSRGAYDDLLALTRALVERGLERPVEIIAVTAGAHEVTGEEPLAPGVATTLGPCLVIPQEHPWIRCRHIDLAASGPLDDDALRWLASEVSSAAPEPVVARRGAHRWAHGAVPSTLTSPASATPLLRQGATYAIVGRVYGGLGALLAHYLHDRVRARVVVIGPDVPAENTGDSSTRPEVAAVAALRSAGIDVATFTAELGDQAALEAAFRAAEERCGRIAGVFHASWMGRPELACPVAQIESRHTARLFQDRVAGLPALEAVLRGREPDFCVVQSSLSAVIGGVGFAAYAAANAFADAFASAVNRRVSYPWLSVAWEARAQEVAGNFARTQLGAEIAQLALTDDDVVAVLDRLLVRERSGAVIVSPGDLALRNAHARRQDAQATANPVGSEVTDRDESLESAYAAPGDEVERAIAEIWQEFVNVRPVGIHDDYFALGGTSLAAVQILARVKARFGVEVALEAILGASPTVAYLAQVVRERRAATEDQALADLVAMVEDLSPEEALRLLDEPGLAPGLPPSEHRASAVARDADAKG